MPAEKNLPKKNSQPQRERFIETARELEADEGGKAFDMAMGKIVPERRPQKIFGKPAK